ncbi:MAG TPA: hydrogenase maturation protease [Planctomycetaceae bacterium]|nr:hydrogenase maturation protease [Planctomycetaceae bacterium]
MNRSLRSILLIGYGNPARADDGLGPALAEWFERLDLPGVTVEADYQLTVEDAAEAACHDLVLFADASLNGPEPFWIRRLEPATRGVGFSSHGVQPEAVLALARDLFGAEPEGYLVGIRGYDFSMFRSALTEKAQENLAAAAAYLESALRNSTSLRATECTEQIADH